VKEGETANLRGFLSERPWLDLTEIIDEKGFSTLHWAAYKNSVGCADLLINHMVKLTGKEQI
jgi:hypothetical protein